MTAVNFEEKHQIYNAFRKPFFKSKSKQTVFHDYVSIWLFRTFIILVLNFISRHPYRLTKMHFK